MLAKEKKIVEMTNEEIEHYKTKGWVVLKNVIPDDLLQIVKEEGLYLRKNYEKFSNTQLFFTKHITCASRYAEKLGNCFTAPFIYDIVHKILGDEAWLYIDQINYKLAQDSFAFPPHYDNSYGGEQLRSGKVHSVNIGWVLDNFTDENGTIEVLDENKEWVTLYPKEKDLVIMNGECVHRSGENKSDKERGFYCCMFTDEEIKSAGIFKVIGTDILKEIDYYKGIEFSEPNLTKSLYNLI